MEYIEALDDANKTLGLPDDGEDMGRIILKFMMTPKCVLVELAKSDSTPAMLQVLAKSMIAKNPPRVVFDMFNAATDRVYGKVPTVQISAPVQPKETPLELKKAIENMSVNDASALLEMLTASSAENETIEYEDFIDDDENE